MTINQFIRLDRLSNGAPTIDQFSLQSEQLSDIGDGSYLIENHYIAIDPALVGRLRRESNYAESVRIGEVMHAYCVGKVIETNSETVNVGQMLYGRFDMQRYKVADTNTFAFPIDVNLAPARWYLGVLGTTGTTAYFTLNEICKPQQGEVLVVSSAASSVGSIVGQLAKRAGCRVVGIVSTEEKAALTRREYGYDAVVSYRGKSTGELSRDLSNACPDGVDVYVDNTSGDISEALLELYNDQARIAVVGRVALSHLADTRQDIGRRDNSIILSKRITKQGFVVTDYITRFAEAARHLKALIDSGDLKFKEDVLEGIENTPAAFMRVIDGVNDGKQLVKLC